MRQRVPSSTQSELLISITISYFFRFAWLPRTETEPANLRCVRWDRAAVIPSRAYSHSEKYDCPSADWSRVVDDDLTDKLDTNQLILL